MRLILLMLASLAIVLPGCEEMPRDPEDTLSKVRQGPLRVGIVESPPWTRYDGNTVSGVEVDLVEQFAKELGTNVTWVRGGESLLMPALERFELHLVIGGLTNNSPWGKRVGLSRAYFTNRFVVGVPPGQQLETIDGEVVAVPENLPMLPSIARDHGAEVVTVPDLRHAQVDAVVAPAWQLELLGRTPAGLELHREKHVMAVPPGENGWLMRLDRFLEQAGSQLPDRLRREVGAP